MEGNTVPGRMRLYMQEALSSSDIGVKSARKDFIDEVLPGITLVTAEAQQ